MLKTEEEKNYKAFNLVISSVIQLPELIQNDKDDCLVDVSIKKADLDAEWIKQSVINKHCVIQENFIMFEVPHIAIFLIRNGEEILYSPAEEAQENEIRLYILGTCIGAVLLQRKILPLHGSAVAIDGKAYAIVGDSGAGKSTIAAAFLNRGYQLLSDDVIPVSLMEENVPVVSPAYPQQKLWLESLNNFGMASSNYQPLGERETKFAIPISSQFANEPLPLAGVFELVKTEDEEIKISSVQKMERFLLLFNHTYRNAFVASSELLDWHFSITAKIVNKMNFYRVERPVSYFTAHELTCLILDTLKREEKSI